MNNIVGIILLSLLFLMIVLIAIKCQESLQNRESFENENENKNNYSFQLMPVV